MPEAPHPLPSAWHRSQPPHNTHWACPAFSCPWLMEAEDMESSRDPSATPRELPARNSNCSLAGQSRHQPWPQPQPPGSAAPWSPWWNWPGWASGMKTGGHLSQQVSPGPERSERTLLRPDPHPATTAVPHSALTVPSDAHAAVHIAKLKSWAQDHSVHCREEMSAVLRAAALAVPTTTQPQGGQDHQREMPVLVPGLRGTKQWCHRPSGALPPSSYHKASAVRTDKMLPQSAHCCPQFQLCRRALWGQRQEAEQQPGVLTWLHDLLSCNQLTAHIPRCSAPPLRGDYPTQALGGSERCGLPKTVHCFPFHMHVPPSYITAACHVAAIFKDLSGLLSGQSQVQRKLPFFEWVAFKDMELESRTPCELTCPCHSAPEPLGPTIQPGSECPSKARSPQASPPHRFLHSALLAQLTSFFPSQKADLTLISNSWAGATALGSPDPSGV